MSLIVLLALLLAPADAKVFLLDGQSHTGSLSSISASEVVVEENGRPVQLPIAEVLALEFPIVKSVVSEEPQFLVLSDGSQLYGSSITRNAKQLTIESARLGKTELSNSLVRSVRLQAENPAFRPQWTTFLKRESEKDLLVVAKRDGSGLDFLAGVVASVAADKVTFLLDGETVPVPAARVYGVVFARPSAETPQAAVKSAGIRITSAQGDLIAATGVTLDAELLKIEAGWGASVQLPLDQVRKIDLSSTRVQFLSDLEPLEERFDGVDPEGSLLAGLIDKNQQLLLFGPRRDTTMERQARLRLRGREFTKGLCLHSRTEIAWPLDEQFSSLDAMVGVDDEVAFNGSHAVALKITGDNKVLFEKLISTTDDPIPLRITLDGVSTLRVLVDFGDGNSTCDWLDLADARLVIAKDKQK